MAKLTGNEIQSALKGVSGWELDGDAIQKNYSFPGFMDAIGFINQIAELAEKHNHHPELFNVYNRVTVRYTTHDAGGLTKKDFAIATEIDQLLA